MKLLVALVTSIAVLLSVIVGCTGGVSYTRKSWSELDAVGMSYREARVELIRLGWIPKETNLVGPDGPEREWLTAGDYLDLGYIEIQQCAGTGLNPCILNFTRNKSNCLRVITEGEAMDAKVVVIERHCHEG